MSSNCLIFGVDIDVYVNIMCHVVDVLLKVVQLAKIVFLSSLPFFLFSALKAAQSQIFDLQSHLEEVRSAK